MSLESFMLKDEVKEVEYIASNRFKDKEGNVEKWKLKTITADENDAIRKQCYKQKKHHQNASYHKLRTPAHAPQHNLFIHYNTSPSSAASGGLYMHLQYPQST